MRLQVAVDDPFVVRRRHGGRDGQHDVRGLLERQPPAPLEQLREVFAVEQLHDQERVAGFAADVGDVDDVRVADARRQLRLAQEPRARAGNRRHGLIILIATFFPIPRCIAS